MSLNIQFTNGKKLKKKLSHKKFIKLINDFIKFFHMKIIFFNHNFFNKIGKKIHELNKSKNK